MLPENGPTIGPVYLTGNINDWQPNDERFRLLPDPVSGLLTTLIPNPSAEVAYKFTRGSWATEEVNAAGQPVANRIWQVEKDCQVVYAEITGWRDNEPVSVQASVRIWHEALWMPQLNRSRRIWVYVPPDYDHSDRIYPVVYMHDAQNLFVHESAQTRNWGVARTLNRLFTKTNWGCIVVGIEHGDENRLAEYSPVTNPTHGGGEGSAYLAFLTDTLKPLVDAAFRTRPDAANTAMIGSSMGGLISVYAALRHGDVFGKVAAFSPSLWWSDDVYTLAAAAPYNFVHKLVLLAGAQESEEMLPDVLAMYYTLVDNGYFEDKIHLDFYQDGTHTEWFWGRELERAVRWLFSDDIPPMHDDPVAIFDEARREIRLLKPVLKAELRNSYGKVIYSLDGWQGDRIPLKCHWYGLFALQCLLPNQRIELKKAML